MEQPLVVYHVAGMGNWPEVVSDQLDLLKEVGLTEILLTHVGVGLTQVLRMAEQRGLKVTVVRHDENIAHFETFALLEIERLAKVVKTERPLLYLHTKGVSSPGDPSKKPWRKVMEEWVVRRWRENIEHLKTHHVCCWAWWPTGSQHATGNFWMASPAWLRTLPDFVEYHNHVHHCSRMSCEMWLGAGPTPPIVRAATQLNYAYWCDGNFDWSRWLPPPTIDHTEAGTLTLTELFNRCGSDKANLHAFGEVYDALFPFESRPLVRSVLEIGVLNGRSVAAWEHAFPNAEVHGLDLKTVAIPSACRRTKLHQLDATHPEAVGDWLDRFTPPGGFDLIVDDGSHTLRDQLMSALLLEKALSRRGFYVIEDIPKLSRARLLAERLGGIVLDRRGVKQRFDDLLVLRNTPRDLVRDLHCPVLDDLVSPFGVLP